MVLILTTFYSYLNESVLKILLDGRMEVNHDLLFPRSLFPSVLCHVFVYKTITILFGAPNPLYFQSEKQLQFYLG